MIYLALKTCLPIREVRMTLLKVTKSANCLFRSLSHVLSVSSSPKTAKEIPLLKRNVLKRILSGDGIGEKVHFSFPKEPVDGSKPFR